MKVGDYVEIIGLGGRWDFGRIIEDTKQPALSPSSAAHIRGVPVRFPNAVTIRFLDENLRVIDRTLAEAAWAIRVLEE